LTTHEMLWALATGNGPVMEKARAMIGEGELALLLAKATLSGTSERLSSTKVGEVLGLTQSAAHRKIENVGFKKIE
jgi:hypothetical protein